MKRSAVLTLLVAACGSPAAAPSSPTTGTTTTAAAAPACTPTLVDVAAGRVPEIMSKLLGPDGEVRTVAVGAVQTADARYLEWALDGATDPMWLREPATAELERLTGAVPETYDDVLETGVLEHRVAWRDANLHELVVAGMPADTDAFSVTYRCGVAQAGPMTAADAAALSPDLATGWVEPWLLEVLGAHPLAHVRTDASDGARTYAWTLTVPAALTALDAAARARGMEVGADETSIGGAAVPITVYYDADGRYQVNAFTHPDGAQVEIELVVPDGH